MPRLQELYDRLVALHPTSVGKATSKEERERRQLPESTLVYGEIKFEPFAMALLKVGFGAGPVAFGRPHAPPGAQIRDRYGGLRGEGQMFYDIGSGTGKAVRVRLCGRWIRALPHPARGQVFAAALIHPFERCVGIEVP